MESKEKRSDDFKQRYQYELEQIAIQRKLIHEQDQKKKQQEQISIDTSKLERASEKFDKNTHALHQVESKRSEQFLHSEKIRHKYEDHKGNFSSEVNYNYTTQTNPAADQYFNIEIQKEAIPKPKIKTEKYTEVESLNSVSNENTKNDVTVYTDILRERRNKGLYENNINHLVSSNSGRKHVFIVDNHPSIRRDKSELNLMDTDRLGKHALKHKSNRYVSGAIGILETSVNGEYVILENLSSSKTVNLQGWFIHRQVPDQGINIIYKFPCEVWIRNGEQLRVWSNVAAKIAGKTFGVNDFIADEVQNWGLYSKFSLTKLINAEGVDKAVLTQTLLSLSKSSHELNVPLVEETTTTNSKTVVTTTKQSNSDKMTKIAKSYESLLS